MTEQSVLSCLLGPRAPDPFWLALPCGAAEQPSSMDNEGRGIC